MEIAVEIVVECDCSAGLERLYSPQWRVMFYTLPAYNEAQTLQVSFRREMRRDGGEAARVVTAGASRRG